MWHLPFNHESILTVIESNYFKNTGSFGQKHMYLFHSSLPADKYPKESKEAELPKPMIAVSATAVCPCAKMFFECSPLYANILPKVYAGIVAWESGEHVVSSTFTAKRFEDKYHDLVRLLEDLQKRNALQYHQHLHKMFLKVMYVFILTEYSCFCSLLITHHFFAAESSKPQSSPARLCQ